MHHSDDYFAWVIMQSMANSIPGTNSLWKIAIEIGRMEKLGAVDLQVEMKQIEKQIDEALCAGDKEEFMRLSKRYKYLKAEGC
jgi:hypothetical protein